MRREQIPELFGYLNDAADLLEDTCYHDVLVSIMKKIDEQTTELDWHTHFGEFYSSEYKDERLTVKLLNNFVYDRVEFVIHGHPYRGVAKNLREAELAMMRYLDAL